jgi:LytR cell envelope-related transcriptional attenuator
MDLIEQVGAVLGLIAFIGLAVLVLLYFQQARDVRRLREWAGRAPERAAAAAEEAAAKAAEEAGVPPEEAVAGDGAPLRERLASRFRVPADLRERLPGTPYLAVIGVGVVLVAVGIVTGAFGLLGDEDGKGSKGSKAAPPTDVEVAVLNGTGVGGAPGVPGLADTVAKEVKSAGYKVGAVTDAASSANTVIMYQPDSEESAKQVATDLEKPLGKTPVQQMTGEVQTAAQGAPVAVLIGLDDSNL